MKHKSFMDIERYKASFNDGFEKGDHIVIQEKIDGANCAVRYDSETDMVVAQSRKNILDLQNNLRGFWEWSQTLSKEMVKAVLGNNLVLFGEWAVHHSVEYPADKYNNAYFYDVYDTENCCYLPQDKVKEIIVRLNLTYVPVFYDGEFISWEHCIGFVGKTELGGEYGEGIVIKNQTKLNNPNKRLPFYTKIVGEKFAETKGHTQKVINPEKIKAVEENKALAETIITKARVEKLLNKFVDEGVLPEDWSSKEMPIVAKNLTKAVYDDCVKEEAETVSMVENFGKVANGIAMNLARQILNER